MARTATITFEGKQLEVPVVQGSEGELGMDISQLLSNGDRDLHFNAGNRAFVTTSFAGYAVALTDDAIIAAGAFEMNSQLSPSIARTDCDPFPSDSACGAR